MNPPPFPDQISCRLLNGDVRLGNLLLTMLQRVDVKAEKFQDSVGVMSQIVG